MTNRLLLVRHGVTSWNLEGRFQGHLDPPLDPIGFEQARQLGARLAAEEHEPMRIVSSPLTRASATAELVYDALRHAGTAVSLSSDAGLMEIGQGEWSGRTHDEIARSEPAEYAAWRAGGGSVTPPGGEAIEDARARIVATLDALIPEGSDTLCLVSHGGILRLAAAHLLDWPVQRAWSLEVDNVSLSELWRAAVEERWQVAAWNDTSHLQGASRLHDDAAEGPPLAL